MKEERHLMDLDSGNDYLAMFLHSGWRKELLRLDVVSQLASLDRDT